MRYKVDIFEVLGTFLRFQGHTGTQEIFKGHICLSFYIRHLLHKLW